MQCYALAAAGQAGIVRMLEIMEDEVTRALGLLGVTSYGKLDRSYLRACGAGQCAACVLGLPVVGTSAVSVLNFVSRTRCGAPALRRRSRNSHAQKP